MILEKEINQISNEQLRNAVKDCIMEKEALLKILPATTSGRYHPPEQRGPGGVVLHIRRMCNLASQLARHLALAPYETDLVLAACILHDISHTEICSVDEHGKVSRNDEVFRKHHSLLSAQVAMSYLTLNDIEPTSDLAMELHGIISAHMGAWYQGWRQPTTKLELIVSILDFIDSRENVHIEVL